LIQSDSTRVPPVTALRSPPDSRITGALSPVITDSSIEGDAFNHFPIAGNDVARLADHDVAGAQRRRRYVFDAAAGEQALAHHVGLGLAQRVRLRLAARFGHRFGEVREQDREPQPKGDLHAEACVPAPAQMSRAT
jgi:hypothetical protein